MSLSVLSSPLHHTYTPQRNRHYVPQTPSPLRTSRNANLMPPPSTPVSPLKATPDSKRWSSSFTTPTPATSINSTPDSGALSRASSNSASALPFQFQTRSRSQSPQASLAKSNAAAKARRSSLFLDKVRQRREDSRFETRGEQVLRMEFVRERRAWEERLMRKAPSFVVESDDTMMDELDHDMGVQGVPMNDQNAIPSPTEDREIEELLSYLEADETQLAGGNINNAYLTAGSARRPPSLDPMSDDEDYDRLFMEVMADDVGISQTGTLEGDDWCQHPQEEEMSMDLS